MRLEARKFAALIGRPSLTKVAKINVRLAGVDDYRNSADQEFQALQMAWAANTDRIGGGGQRVIHTLRCLLVLEAQLPMKRFGGDRNRISSPYAVNRLYKRMPLGV
jgi:hypothetical protein